MQLSRSFPAFQTLQLQLRLKHPCTRLLYLHDAYVFPFQGVKNKFALRSVFIAHFLRQVARLLVVSRVPLCE
jgi:hypothetical protein